MESLGWRVHPGYAVLHTCQVTFPKDSTAPAINGNACFSVLARPEDRVVQTGHECQKWRSGIAVQRYPWCLHWARDGPACWGKAGLVAVSVWPYSFRHISEGAVGLSSNPVSLVLEKNAWRDSDQKHTLCQLPSRFYVVMARGQSRRCSACASSSLPCM